MALSNMLREPRRELTESVIGIIVFVAFTYADLRFATWIKQHTLGSGPDGLGLPIVIGMLAGVAAIIGLAIILFVTHEVGDSVCNALAKGGLELRPKQRY